MCFIIWCLNFVFMYVLSCDVWMGMCWWFYACILLPEWFYMCIPAYGLSQAWLDKTVETIYEYKWHIFSVVNTFTQSCIMVIMRLWNMSTSKCDLGDIIYHTLQSFNWISKDWGIPLFSLEKVRTGWGAKRVYKSMLINHDAEHVKRCSTDDLQKLGYISFTKERVTLLMLK